MIYAFLIDALISSAGNNCWYKCYKWLKRLPVCNWKISRRAWWPFFFYTNSGQQNVIVSQKGDIWWGHHRATLLWHITFIDSPSCLTKKNGSNEVMIWFQHCQCHTMYPPLRIWACLLQEIITGTSEIAVVGTDSSLFTPNYLGNI